MRTGALAGSGPSRFVKAENPEDLRQEFYEFLKENPVDYASVPHSIPNPFYTEANWLVRTGLDRKELIVDIHGRLFVMEKN